MYIEYENKKSNNKIFDYTPKNRLGNDFANCIKKNISNIIIHGDNMDAMKTMLDDHRLHSTVDLVYIDPPFSTNTNFHINGNGRVSTISHSKNDNIAYSDKLKGSEFLEFLRERLYLIRELMSDKSSIYLHIDYKVGHYVKIIMDEVFGINNFRGDITRIKCNPKNFKRKSYGNIKDLILFYTKTDDYIWNEPTESREQEELNNLFNKIDRDGRRYTTNPLHAPGETRNGNTGKEWKGIKPPEGRHWRYGTDVLDDLEKKGLIEWSKNGVPRKIIFQDDYKKKKVQDIWEFKDTPNPIYPTEKNNDLLKRIIEASSNEDSLVFDCFSGSGGTLYVADRLKRRWLGIDSSKEAIKIIEKRFKEKNNLFSSDLNKFTL